ncbi:MAG: hypothetical protein Q8942_04345 [Bacillota bacterium]|nr:hypothetical protein [Bacillota bacterium]
MWNKQLQMTIAKHIFEHLRIVFNIIFIIWGLIMVSKKLNSKDEAEFSVTENFSSEGKSFEQLMQEVISQTINSKNFLSNYSKKNDSGVELQHTTGSCHSKEQAIRSE